MVEFKETLFTKEVQQPLASDLRETYPSRWGWEYNNNAQIQGTFNLENPVYNV